MRGKFKQLAAYGQAVFTVTFLSTFIVACGSDWPIRNILSPQKVDQTCKLDLFVEAQIMNHELVKSDIQSISAFIQKHPDHTWTLVSIQESQNEFHDSGLSGLTAAGTLDGTTPVIAPTCVRNKTNQGADFSILTGLGQQFNQKGHIAKTGYNINIESPANNDSLDRLSADAELNTDSLHPHYAWIMNLELLQNAKKLQEHVEFLTSRHNGAVNFTNLSFYQSEEVTLNPRYGLKMNFSGPKQISEVFIVIQGTAGK